ncbi:BTB/POZ and MATH domain-containing protein 1-like [Triticum dicoccoides]|uniref:BTB/POZ and MATH domain-containing protein 1-like n=1 Tax=Triticum dicoccoides TaxID=85692 RepID=UPI001890B49D|nr:BTB/POZ and MATH domain-containing protein 1-like [Triticum dicoccoides]
MSSTGEPAFPSAPPATDRRSKIFPPASPPSYSESKPTSIMAEPYEIPAAMIAESEKRSYVLKIDGYSMANALLKNGECMTSAPFSVGGHNWVVRYYPNGYPKHCDNYISLYVQLEAADAEDVKAKAKLKLSVLDKNGNPVPSYSRTIPLHTFSRRAPDRGYHDFIHKAGLEVSPHLRDDCLTIRCDVTVVKDIDQEARIPPSDLHRHLGDLLQSNDGADLTFQVGGRTFPAHRCVLTARSSVFKAGLLGALVESSCSTIEIRDMEPDVFEYLLHFIYTDSVPLHDVVMAGHLLEAADRYDIPRLKVICEEKLCSHIDSNMVATSLALARQHGFRRLNKACLQFLASPSNFDAMVASDGFEHLLASYGWSVVEELRDRIIRLNSEKDIIMTFRK